MSLSTKVKVHTACASLGEEGPQNTWSGPLSAPFLRGSVWCLH